MSKRDRKKDDMLEIQFIWGQGSLIPKYINFGTDINGKKGNKILSVKILAGF